QRTPETAGGCVPPDTAPARTVPINRMTVRSFIASPGPGSPVAAGRPVTLKGSAFDGGSGIREVQLSADDGAPWQRARLGQHLGRYSFREWAWPWTPSRPGPARVMVRAFNAIGEAPGAEPEWNPARYLRKAVELS